MPSSRILVTAAASLLLGVPVAHAAVDTAPQALKKPPEQGAPAPAAPVAPVPEAPAAQRTEPPAAVAPKPDAKVIDRATVTPGTTKKSAPIVPGDATRGAPANDNAASATPGTRRARGTTPQGASRVRSGSATAGSRAQANPRATRGARRAAERRARRAADVRAEVARAAGLQVAAERRAAQARRARVAPAAAPVEADDGYAGLESITHAADEVVEVIPGAIVLALAGLCALVLVLIGRSWLMERRRTKALECSYGVTVEALATAIEAKDHTTGNHIERVRKLGLLLARQIVPREVRDPQMAYGFLLHDIGKLAVPDAILRAPGKLSDEDWALLRRHPDEGVRMLSQVPFLDRAIDVVRHHHERWDGSGYPDGLRGEEIPQWARIFAVVDALDAITADRPYRERRPYESALEEIRSHAGTQFDPAVVDALERLDPAVVIPLLEPAQVLDREPLAELPEPKLPAPLVAA